MTKFLNGACTYDAEEMSRNAYQKGTLYREEAVALKAVHYYNSVIAEDAIQKKRNIRLLPEG